MKLLPAVFEVECQVLGMVCPELVINNTLYPTRPVNFVFDMNNPGSGLVYLNPDKLKAMEPYAPHAFLIHETRHAYQFQLAFDSQSLLAKGYKSAFMFFHPPQMLYLKLNFYSEPKTHQRQIHITTDEF